MVLCGNRHGGSLEDQLDDGTESQFWFACKPHAKMGNSRLGRKETYIAQFQAEDSLDRPAWVANQQLMQPMHVV